MLLIRCPWCGLREEAEFSCGGEAHIVRPLQPDTLTDEGVGRLSFHAREHQGLAARAMVS